jgi:hypothetical protein
MKIALTVPVVAAALAGAGLAIRGLRAGPRALTADESLIRDLAREAFREKTFDHLFTTPK